MNMLCVCPECKNTIDLSRYPNLTTGMVIECNHCGMTLLVKNIADDGTVAFRITEHPLAVALCKAIDGPLVSTSANISAHESPYDIKDVVAMFAHEAVQPDIIIDGGKLPHESPSTIVRIHEDGTLEVLREGEMIVQLANNN